MESNTVFSFENNNREVLCKVFFVNVLMYFEKYSDDFGVTSALG